VNVLLVVLLILVVVAARELVAPATKQAVTQPLRLLVDFLLKTGVRLAQPGPMALAMATVLPMLPVWVLFASLDDGGVGSLWHFLLTLLVTLPVFMDRRLPSVLEASRKGWLDSHGMDNMKERLAESRSDLLITALQELFAPLFWLIVLGPLATLFYYLVRCCDEQIVAPTVGECARKLRFWLDWLPSRALAVSFALAGDFLSVWKYLGLSLTESRSSIASFLAEAGQLADRSQLNQTLETPIDMVRQLAHIDSLCQRVLGLWVVIMVLHALLP
jgi:membrane protein required for beta-lactamase induction